MDMIPDEMTAAEYRDHVLRSMDETTWQAWVETEAVTRGWTCWHDHDSRRNDAGFPDLLLIHPEHGIRWLELKTERGRIRPEQRAWLGLLRSAGAQAAAARPRHADAVIGVLNGAPIVMGDSLWIGIDTED